MIGLLFAVSAGMVSLDNLVVRYGLYYTLIQTGRKLAGNVLLHSSTGN